MLFIHLQLYIYLFFIIILDNNTYINTHYKIFSTPYLKFPFLKHLQFPAKPTTLPNIQLSCLLQSLPSTLPPACWVVVHQQPDSGIADGLWFPLARYIIYRSCVLWSSRLIPTAVSCVDSCSYSNRVSFCFTNCSVLSMSISGHGVCAITQSLQFCHAFLCFSRK